MTDGSAASRYVDSRSSTCTPSSKSRVGFRNDLTSDLAMSYMASSFGHKCRGLFKLAVAVTGVLILLQYVFGVAVIGGFRSWRGHLTYDVNDTLGADRHDGRRFMDRNAWRDDVTLGLHRRVEQDTGLPLCPMIPPNLSKLWSTAL